MFGAGFMRFELIFAGNVDENRVDAEISCKRWYKRHWELAATVYKKEDRFEVLRFGRIGENSKTNKLIEEAKRGLDRYVNAEGISGDEGLTRAGIAFSLMKKSDGTALGQKIE